MSIDKEKFLVYFYLMNKGWKGRKYWKPQSGKKMIGTTIWVRLFPEENEILNKHLAEFYPNQKAVWIRKAILNQLIKEKKSKKPEL